MRIEAAEATLASSLAVPEVHWYTHPKGKELEELKKTGQPLPFAKAGRTKKSKKAANSRYNEINPLLNLDLKTLVKILKVSTQKLHILRMLRRHNWMELLRLMPKELLINGLRLFDKEKLVKLLMRLPKPMLIRLLLRIFKLEELIQKMPTGELLRVLRSKRLNNRELTKGIMQMEPRFILMLLQKIYGHHDYSKLKPYDLVRIFMHTPKERLMEAFKTLPFKALQPLVIGFVKKDPTLLLGISEAFILKLLEKTSKPTLLQGCEVLPTDILLKMLAHLPDQFLMLATAQVDDKTFEEYLIAKHADLLMAMAA